MLTYLRRKQNMCYQPIVLDVRFGSDISNSKMKIQARVYH